MRLRNLKNSKEIINNSNYIINDPFSHIGKWKDVFNNDNPIYIEIGMGKGKFILENALKYPDINFIGIERYDGVMARAVKNINNYKLTNLKLVRIDALELEKVFSNEIDLIYLNFSDPWPKDRHEKRRLTYITFLSTYDKALKDTKHIIMKTDNRDLFEYSVSSLSKYGYTINELCCDLHKKCDDIITTEYEEKFMKLGPIYRVDATKDKIKVI